MPFIFVTLWIVWAAFLYGGMILGKGNAEQTHRCPTWARMGSSLALTAMAWIATTDSTRTTYPWLLAVGMTFGFIGDLFMARLLIKSDSYLVFGMASFAIGHLFYIQVGAFNPIVWAMTALGVAILAYLITMRKILNQTIINLLAIPYSVLLGTTVASFLSQAIANAHTPFIIMTIGAILFLLSDFILALQLFRKVHFRWIGDAVWWTYGTGQMLIIFTLIALV